MTYANQSDAKAAAREAANRLGINMYVTKVASRYEVSTKPSDKCIVVCPVKEA